MKKISIIFALISLTIVFIFSCQKDKTYQAGDSANLKTTVSGIVLDESNAPLNGVTVSGYGETTTTNQYGTFVLKNIYVNKDRCVLQFSKTGFFKRSHGFIASGNTVNYVRIILMSNVAAQNFSSTAGGTFTLPDNSSVLFQPNSFVTANGSAYTGTVNLIVKHLSPDDTNFGFMIPGGDLLGKDLNNKDVALYTYGMLGVELTGSSGEALQLASGTSATLTFSIAASQLSSAPGSIPLWYFDETVSLWKEEGSATKTGNNYVGDVKHFSWWNCDYSGPKSYLHGKVIDCHGDPMPNIVVSMNGYADVITDQNGEYNDWIPSGLTFTIQMQVLANNNGGIILNSQIENIPSLAPNQIFIVPDLVVPCSTRISGTISGCNGSSTNAFIYVSYNSGVNFQYCMTGRYNIIVPTNTFILLDIYEGSVSEIKTITSGAAGITTEIGNTVLCDNGIQPDNSFYINGNGYVNELIQIDTTNTGTTTNGFYNFDIFATGVNHANGLSASIGFGISDTLQGNYVCDSLPVNNAEILLDYNDFISYEGGTQLVVHLTDVQYIGGRVKGTFSGTLSPSDSLTQLSNVTITNGKFNVARTQ